MSEKNQSCFRTSIGGQALIEGILMRGPQRQAIVVRDQEGNLVEKTEELKLIRDRYPILGLPMIRGTVNFLDSMVKGVQALMYSADFYPEEEAAQPSKFELWLEKHLSSKALEKAVIALAVAMGVGLSIFLFMVLPTFLTGGILHFFPDFPLWGRNVVEGVLKIAIFLVYLAMCSNMSDIKRVFQYHGAEHKTIFCYERGLPLTVENVRAQSRFHPRCGTSFMILMLLVGIIIGLFIPLEQPLLRTLIKLALLPLTMGIGYELIKFAGKHDNILTRIVSAPGVALQHLTTREPDDGMIECAILAFREVLPEGDPARTEEKDISETK